MMGFYVHVMLMTTMSLMFRPKKTDDEIDEEQVKNHRYSFELPQQNECTQEMVTNGLHPHISSLLPAEVVRNTHIAAFSF